jgi:hypothetical protein
MTRLLLAFLLIGTAAAPVALSAGCSSTETKPPQGPAGAGEQKDTEMSHEPCDLKSSDAKGLDANGDGNPDIIKVISGGREVCRAVDFNMDRMIDVFVYYDDAGRVRRRESGFDRDAQPDEISYYQNGALVRKERETNNDRKIDTWSYFQGGRLVKEERDSTGDGYVDQWWTFDRPNDPECATVLTDSDGDGKPDEDSKIDTCKKGQGDPFAPKVPAPGSAAPSASASAAPAPDPPPPVEPEPTATPSASPEPPPADRKKP